MGINNLFAAGGVLMMPPLGFSVLAVALAVECLFANTFKGFYQRQMALIQEYGGEFEGTSNYS